ncbi:MAG: hypothetical protein K0S11_1855 [Gammaproteobacteria bacterium]|jgi:hypothetical protein|nr:hypothetical protein [Gammaproteobacteria bacterium]
MHPKTSNTHSIKQHIISITDSTMEFNNVFKEASSSLLQNSFLAHKLRNHFHASLPKKMVAIIENCLSLLAECQEHYVEISLTEFTEMLQCLLGNMNNWRATRFLGIKFEKNHDFFSLAKLIKKIIKEVLKHQKGIPTEYLEHAINSINNHIADYYLEKGYFHDAEAYFTRSVNAHIIHSDLLQIHAQFAQLKAIELKRTNHESEAEKLFAIIEHNLSEINQTLKSDRLDNSCVSTLFIFNLCNFLVKTQAALVERLKSKTVNHLDKLRVSLKLIYEIYLRLNSFRNSERFNQHINKSIDPALVLAFVRSQQKIDLGLNESSKLIKSLTEIANKSPAIMISPHTSPSFKKKTKQKIATSSAKANLKAKEEAKQKNKQVVSKTDNSTLKSKTQLDYSSAILASTASSAQAEPVFFEQAKLVKQPQSSELSNNETATVIVEPIKSNSVGLKSSSMQDFLSAKSVSKQKASEPKLSLTIPVVHAITSSYLPSKTLAGILPDCIEALISKSLAAKFTEVIERGRVVGSKGKGIKLVTQEECLKRGLENVYIYKLKDPSLDERIYGREATAKELQQIGTQAIKDYKKIVIFDLFVDSHKQQAKHIKLITEEIQLYAYGQTQAC